MKDAIGCGVFVLVIAVIALAVYSMGYGHGRDTARYEMRESAIEAGAAEYVVDSKTGHVEFKWKK